MTAQASFIEGTHQIAMGALLYNRTYVLYDGRRLSRGAS